MRGVASRLLAPVLAVASLVAVSGCVAYPAGYGYGYAENGYYAAPEATVVVPAPVFGFGYGYGGGYRGGYGGGYGHRWGGGGHWR